MLKTPVPTPALGAATPSAGLPSAIDAVVIGASAGAIDALGQLLPTLPAQTPWPIVVVVHLPPNRASLLVELFAPRCAVAVREAADKLPVTPGIWFAPPDYHLLIEASHTFALNVDEPVNYSRPAIDVLFESVADAYGSKAVALVLTGASADGAHGARAIREAGGFVMVQDPTTAGATTMPLEAIERAHPQLIASLTDLALALRNAALGSPSTPHVSHAHAPRPEEVK